MKKKILILLFVSSLVSVAQVNQTTYNFDTTTESFVQNNGTLEATPTGFLTFTPTNGPNFAAIQQTLNFIDADTYKFAHVRLSNQSAVNNQLNFARSNGGSAGLITISTEDGATFNDYVIELTDGAWTGSQSGFKLYPRESVSKKNNGGAIIFDHIIFSEGAVLALEEIELYKSRLYPNPVKDILTINTAGNNVRKLEIYDLLGEKKASKTNSNNINIQSLTNGMYLVMITTDTEVSSSKFLKI